MTDAAYEVYALRGAKGSDRPREWLLLAWAYDEDTARNLYLQACARTTSPLRLVNDGNVVAERSRV